MTERLAQSVGKPHALEFSGVRFSYDGVANAVDIDALCIERATLTCVLGSNGSGKSTLARLVCGIMMPDEGRVLLGGRDAARERISADGRAVSALVFQNPDDQLVSSIVEDDVAFGPENLGVSAPELRKRVTHALGAVGLAGFEKREVATLSGGQKQRVALAGSLAMKPDVLVLDEATAMLDPQGRAETMRLARSLADTGTTVIAITQLPDEAVCADRVIALSEGRIALDGSPADVLARIDDMRALGLEAPFPAQLCACLAGLGVRVVPTASFDNLLEQLCRLRSNR